jgi:excisionase family DNA binding protein
VNERLRAREVAEALDVSPETVLRWTRRGNLPAIRLPSGGIRYRPDELADWLDARATATPSREVSAQLTPYPKTERSRRRVPLTQRALDAIESLPPRLATPLQFPAAKGGHIGLDTWRTREWYPALDAAGIERRGPYALRHTFATEALAAGVSIFELARLMGTSVAMIDRTYGHLAQDTDERIRARLDARATRSGEEMASAVNEDGANETRNPATGAG